MYAPPRDFYHAYEIEAMDVVPEERSSFWLTLLQASGIFIVITLIVFGVANYQFIKAQLVSWRKNDDELKSQFIDDVDADGLPDWWETQYHLDSTDPNNVFLDADNDGANNLVEYQYNINPIEPDTDRDGYFDGEEIRKGFNPNGIGRMDSDKDGIYDWWEDKYGLDKKDELDAALDPDQDGLSNLQEFQYQTDPVNPDSDKDGAMDGDEISRGQNPMGSGALVSQTSQEASRDADNDGLDIFFEGQFGTDPTKADSDNDTFDDYREVNRGYDPTGEGMISATIDLPRIGVKAPIIWSQSEDQAQIKADLEKGILHYPGTAMIGMRGNSYLTGHSSYYAWSKSAFKEVFKELNKLQPQDKIILHMALKSGRTFDVVYAVRSQAVVKPDDPELFRDYEGYEMTLVTCWPIGTDWKRLMVKADLENPLPQ